MKENVKLASGLSLRNGTDAGDFWERSKTYYEQYIYIDLLSICHQLYVFACQCRGIKKCAELLYKRVSLCEIGLKPLG